MESVAEIAVRTAAQCREILANMLGSDSEECARCGGTGWVVDGSRLAHPCDCSIERRVRSRLPKLYWSARLEDFPATVVQNALEWLLDARQGLRITGAPGTGKTHLAAALVRHLTAQNQAAMFRTCSRIYRELRQCFADGSSERVQMEELFNARFLVLDDLGAGGLSDFERRTTLEILDERLSACRPTVVTTNWALSEIAARMDDRIGSRLCTSTHIELPGADRRTEDARLVLALKGTPAPARSQEVANVSLDGGTRKAVGR